MFPGNTWVAARQYNFDGSELFLNWAKENNLKVHAHGLGYVRKGNSPAPEWLVFQQITEENKPEFKAIYEHYLDTTLKQWKSKVYMYDVCNESLRQGPYNNGGSPAYDTGKFLWKLFQEGNNVASGFNYFDYTFRKAADCEKIIPSSPICLFINDLQRYRNCGSPYSSHIKNVSIFRSDCYHFNITIINQNSIPSKLFYFYFHKSR
jgi:hypothetical protein